MFFEKAKEFADKPFLWEKYDGAYQPLSWNEVAKQVAAIAQCLKNQGIEPGDRVALICENRAMWLISDFAIMAIGAITVPTYSTNTTNDHLHILSDSGAKAAIVSTNRLAERLIPAIDQTDEVQFIIALETPEVISKKAKLLKWDNIIHENKVDNKQYCYV